jgi:hypothetical protein
MKQVTVNGCSNCPLSQQKEDWIECGHPDGQSFLTYDYKPTICPLLTELITIKLEKDGDTEN